MGNAALEPGRLYNMVMDGGHTFMAIWKKEEKKAAESRLHCAGCNSGTIEML